MVGLALSRRSTAVIVSALLGCAAAAWLFTIQGSNATVVGSMAVMGAGLFLITWLVMMVAMMFPAVVPITLVFASVTRTRGEGYTPTAAFVLGYIAVWTAVGLVPLAMIQATDAISMAAPSWVARATGVVIVVAGLYQFTPLKDACLRACRSPLGFVMTHDFGGGIASAVRSGASHGLYCLGCCWALVAVLAVLGLMNLAWMAVIAVIFFIEKNVRFGDLLPKVVGVACLAGGLALVLF